MLSNNSSMVRKISAVISLVLGLSLMIVSLAVPAGAANDPESVTVSATVPLIGSLTIETQDQNDTAYEAELSADFNGTINIGSPTDNDLTASQAAVKAQIQTNSDAWTLTQDLEDDGLDHVTTGDAVPFKWKADADGAGSYAAMATTGAPESFGTGSPTGSEIYEIDYRAEFAWTHPDGNYEADIVYTLAYN